MILHAIEIENFGRFVEPLRLGLEPGRLNLLTGPNGSGKSTVLAALAAAFVIPHRSSSDDIKRWKPWGRGLAPRVAVEFTSGSERYRLSKTFTFSSRANARLERLEAGRFVPVCEADAVEERIPEFLGGRRREGVDARTRDWLIAGVLWARQNGLATLQAGAAVQDAVRASLGAQARGDGFNLILREVQRLYEADWTPTGRLARASDVTMLSAAEGKLRQQVEDLQNELCALEDLRLELHRLMEEMAGLDSLFSTREGELSELAEQYKQMDQLVQRQKACAQERARLEEESKRLQLELNTRRSHASRVQAAGQKRAQAGAALLQATERRQQAEEASRAARERLAAEIVRLEKEIRDQNAPPPHAMARLADLAAEQDRLKVQLESALLHAEFVPERDLRLEILQGDPQGALEVKAGEALRISGSPLIELRVPGLGSLRLSGPAQSAEEIRAKLAQVLQDWERGTAPYGTDSLKELQRRREKTDHLTLQLDRLRAEASRHDAGQSETALAVRDARAEVSQWEKTLRDAESELQQLEQERRQFQSDPLDDAQVRARLDELALRLRGVDQELERLTDQLKAFPADLERRFADLKEETEGLRDQLQRTTQEQTRVELRLAARQGSASYSRLAEREAELEETRSQLAAALLRANANKLLSETLQAVVEEAEARILPQLEARAARLYDAIASGFAEAVSLDGSTWRPRGVKPVAGDGPVSPELVSGGEQEQLHLAVRLALADILTEAEPFPVVLDDVLLATDDTRLGRVLELLEERKQKMQFLILTCHPKRFHALGDVHDIQIRNASRAAR